MGYRDVFTLDAGSVPVRDLESGSARLATRMRRTPRAVEVDAAALSNWPAQPVLLDLRANREYRAAHVTGAWWTPRSRLPDVLATLAAEATVVLISDDGLLATLASDDVIDGASQPIRVLHGGQRAWVAAGLPVEEGDGRTLSKPDDAFVRPFEAADPQTAMKNYLDWEVGLLQTVLSHPAVGFGTPAA
jgi:rhodanese-related sulfurtransferase